MSTTTLYGEVLRGAARRTGRPRPGAEARGRRAAVEGGRDIHRGARRSAHRPHTPAAGPLARSELTGVGRLVRVLENLGRSRPERGSSRQQSDLRVCRAQREGSITGEFELYKAQRAKFRFPLKAVNGEVSGPRGPRNYTDPRPSAPASPRPVADQTGGGLFRLACQADRACRSCYVRLRRRHMREVCCALDRLAAGPGNQLDQSIDDARERWWTF